MASQTANRSVSGSFTNSNFSPMFRQLKGGSSESTGCHSTFSKSALMMLSLGFPVVANDVKSETWRVLINGIKVDKFDYSQIS